MGHRKSKGATIDADAVAGNGLLDRRVFLGGTAMAAATAGMTLPDSATADPLAVEPWMKMPGAIRALWAAFQVRGKGRPDVDHGAGHNRHRHVANAASSAQWA